VRGAKNIHWGWTINSAFSPLVIVMITFGKIGKRWPSTSTIISQTNCEMKNETILPITWNLRERATWTTYHPSRKTQLLLQVSLQQRCHQLVPPDTSLQWQNIQHKLISWQNFHCMPRAIRLQKTSKCATIGT